MNNQTISKYIYKESSSVYVANGTDITIYTTSSAVPQFENILWRNFPLKPSCLNKYSQTHCTYMYTWVHGDSVTLLLRAQVSHGPLFISIPNHGTKSEYQENNLRTNRPRE